MSNRWRQGLQRQIYEKQNQLDQIQHREELNHEIVMKRERLEELEEELENQPALNSQEEFERLEQKIESVDVEELQ